MALHKHDQYLWKLRDSLKDEYEELYLNVPLYSKKLRKIAEIDLIAKRHDRIDVYEVKCSYRIAKARKQLRRIRRLMPEVKNTFFFCGESGIVEIIL